MPRKLRLGVAGLGRAFTLMLPTLTAHPRVELVAAADPRPEARDRFASEFGAKAYEDVDALVADPRVEAVYVATPHQYHARHAIAATTAGKHVLVEKPMAVTRDDAAAMAQASRKAGVALVVGPSHSFDEPVIRTRALIESGEFGPVRMITALNFTDFLYRPRRPEELDTAAGGGVVFSQAAHQVDIVRLIARSSVKTVRAFTGAWDPGRATQGAYSAMLGFEDGAFASLTYSGYGHYDSDELCGWIGELGQAKDPTRYGAARRALAGVDATAEAAAKAARNYGGKGYAPASGAPPWHEHFGMFIVSCEKADLRPLPDGVMVYGDEDRRLVELPRPGIPRAGVVDELCDAVESGNPPLHDAEWGLATLETCLAMLRSARESREVAP
ncbi:MAG TPA: Gfo/Idh/MocA family oxidoreductase [Usitatibacter sp.]|nr:Gfo/Idh/MocA family oxidoreductase [Usitatibacter sp.]